MAMPKHLREALNKKGKGKKGKGKQKPPSKAAARKGGKARPSRRKK